MCTKVPKQSPKQPFRSGHFWLQRRHFQFETLKQLFRSPKWMIGMVVLVSKTIFSDSEMGVSHFRSSRFGLRNGRFRLQNAKTDFNILFYGQATVDVWGWSPIVLASASQSESHVVNWRVRIAVNLQSELAQIWSNLHCFPILFDHSKWLRDSKFSSWPWKPCLKTEVFRHEVTDCQKAFLTSKHFWMSYNMFLDALQLEQVLQQTRKAGNDQNQNGCVWNSKVQWSDCELGICTQLVMASSSR